MDNSGSMEPKLPQTRYALINFIRDLNPADEIFVDTFSDRPYELAPLTTDRKIVIDRLEMMRAYGRTALYDAIIQGLQTVSEGCNSRKALLVLTDGIDNASQSDLSQVIKEARSRKVPIYSIGIGEEADVTGRPTLPNGLVVIHGNGNKGDQGADTRALHKLADDTGGETFLVAIESKDNSLKQATHNTSSAIGNEYAVGFLGDGSTNQLRSEVRDHNGVGLKIKSH